MSDGYGRDADKPFVCIRRGRWMFKIMPRNAEGWRLLAMWIAAFLVLTGLHLWFSAGDPPERQVAIATVAYVLATTLWAVAMVRWMLPRSEVIEVEDLIAFRKHREKDSDRRR